MVECITKVLDRKMNAFAFLYKDICMYVYIYGYIENR